jgi:hypothetical protein
MSVDTGYAFRTICNLTSQISFAQIPNRDALGDGGCESTKLIISRASEEGCWGGRTKCLTSTPIPVQPSVRWAFAETTG